MDYRGYPVLVVDDEVENLDAFTLNFGRKFTIKTAVSGAEALELARKDNFAVVIADQRMPNMLGTDFLALLRKERPDAVRMILTGYTDLESVIAAINDGQINRYITKPWEARDVEAVVKNAIDHYRRGMERKRRFRELGAYNRVLNLIAADRSLSRIIKEVLEVVALEFGYARTFLLLGDPAGDKPLRGQAVLPGAATAKPEVKRISAMARGTDAPLAKVVAAAGGFSAEKFTFTAEIEGKDVRGPVEFVCGPFYGAPLVVEGRTVGMLCADRGGAGGAAQRTDRDDARFIATLASQIALATGGALTFENLNRKMGGAAATGESSRPTQDPTKRRTRSGRLGDVKDYPVLVVDDDPAALETFRLNFASTFTVLTAGSAREGLEVCKKRAVAVILTDQRMPASGNEPVAVRETTLTGSRDGYAGMSGIDFLAELRDNDPDCVRMVITGYSDIDEIIGAVNRGLVYRYITKPWDARELGSALRNAIEYYHELVESRRLLREAEVVNRLMTVVAGESDPDRVADAALRIATGDLGYDRVYLFHYDEPSGHLVRGQSAVREGVSGPAAVEKMRIPVLEGGGLLAGTVLSGRPMRSSDGPHTAGGVEISVKSRKATLAVPVGPPNNPIAVLAAELDGSSPRDFAASDELTMTTLAEVLAVSMKNARRIAELKKLAAGQA